jgi:hypothetical protein
VQQAASLLFPKFSFFQGVNRLPDGSTSTTPRALRKPKTENRELKTEN